MFIIVAYDMTCNKRRAKVHRKLKNFINHIQGSVFEGYINNLQLKKMVKTISPLINEDEDSFRVWRIPENLIEKIIVMGMPELMKEIGFHIV